jgi:peptidoglycan-associated lipoprotein
MKDEYMKVNKFVNLLVIGLVLTVAASGCRKKPTPLTMLPGAKAGTPPDMPQGVPIKPSEPLAIDNGPNSRPDPTTTSGTPSNPADLHAGWIKDAQALKTDTVYFDFDSSVIKASEKPKAAAVADYLKANSAKAVLVEGNCDERGTEEYNRSLGERRALALREELIRLGIEPTRVDTISYGKDKPAEQGHDEAAWKMNRRDDFIVLTKPGT